MTRTPSRSATVLLVLLGLLSSGCGLLGNGSYEVVAELTRSFNLFPGSPVRVLGVEVGRITDIEVPAGEQVVRVVMRIDEDVDVPADATATVVPSSLLGERYVQLSPYTQGPRIEDGALIPVDRTQVPYEFDEVLGGLEEFVGGLDGPEVSRFVTNLADTIEGQGAQLGTTLEAASDAIGVLRDNDEELIALASRLADLNETLSSRDQELARLLQDFDTVAASLVDDRTDIDAALTGLVRVTGELGGLLEVNRERLEDDIAVLSRVGRTTARNLDNVSSAILGSTELFRHAERVIDRERAFLPLQDQLFALVPAVTEGIVFRIQGICLQAGLPDDLCQLELIEGLLGGLVCAPPLFPCPPDLGAVPIDEALLNLATLEPLLGDAVIDQLAANVADDEEEDDGDEPAEPAPSDEPEPDPSPDTGSSGGLGGLLEGVGGLLGGSDDEEGER